MKSKLTLFRTEVKRIIDEAEKPLNAKTIFRNMTHRPNLSTVYRSLDFLEKRGHIQSIPFFGESRYYFNTHNHHHFLMCMECHDIHEFDHCTAEKMQRELEDEFKYAITEHILYFKGVCKNCRKVHTGKSPVAE